METDTAHLVEATLARGARAELALPTGAGAEIAARVLRLELGTLRGATRAVRIDLLGDRVVALPRRAAPGS